MIHDVRAAFTFFGLEAVTLKRPPDRGRVEKRCEEHFERLRRLGKDYRAIVTATRHLQKLQRFYDARAE